jgi:dCMP deaminase
METAFLWAQRGTCDRLQVGAVISREGRILVQGYNGAPSGMPHCFHRDSPDPCLQAVHAEASGISWAARNGVALDCAEAHITNLPCPNCCLLLINAGITRVVYCEDYRVREGLALLHQASVSVERIDRIGP